jgi:hypothetical protein
LMRLLIHHRALFDLNVLSSLIPQSIVSILIPFCWFLHGSLELTLDLQENLILNLMLYWEWSFHFSVFLNRHLLPTEIIVLSLSVQPMRSWEELNHL